MLMIFPADISPLSFSPVGEMQITLRSVKDLEMQITLVPDFVIASPKNLRQRV